MPEHPEHVAVVLGGESAEAEVSRATGAGVAEALGARFPRVTRHELHGGVIAELRRSGAQVVFPALHGSPGEDGTFQGAMEIAALPYVGSAVTASALAMNKRLAKLVFRDAGLPVAPDLVPGPETRPAAVIGALGEAVVLKPVDQGSALGVRFACGAREVGLLLEEIGGADPGAWLLERRVPGRELTVGVLDPHGEGPRALPVIEIETPAETWYDYEHRYTPGLSTHRLPAPVPDTVAERARAIAVAAHRALGCRDLSRADFLLDPDGALVLLEVNTLPGMTPTSLYPEAAAAAGLPFPDLCETLVLSAHRRPRRAGTGG